MASEDNNPQNQTITDLKDMEILEEENDPGLMTLVDEIETACLLEIDGT